MMQEPIVPPNASALTTRRTFLGRAALAAATVSIVPRHVLGGDGKPAASEKLNIAGIGVGGQGAGDLHEMEGENIVALCDVDWKYAAHTFKAYPKAEVFKDYRVMLEKRKDIDAVMIATPDHMHAADRPGGIAGRQARLRGKADGPQH